MKILMKIPMKKLPLTLILVLCISGAAFAHSAMDRFWGEVPVDMLLSGDVLIVKPLIVPEGVTLTIDPGTVVRFERFAGGNRIVVKGRLVAVGAKDKFIKFIEKDKGSGPWFGIEFVDGGRGRLERCIIEGATDGIRDPMKGAITKDVNFAR
jgi:hypothetical protein